MTSIPAPPVSTPRRPGLPAAQVGALGTRSHLGVTYATRPGFRPLQLDLHLPALGSTPGGMAPLVMFVHGGGWQMGSRDEVGSGFADWTPTPFEQMAASGLAVASVDYRLSGEATWPAPLEDVTAALRWLRTESAGLGLDAARIALWGESAGAQLAAIAGLLGDSESRGGGPVEAVAAWYGPADLLQLGSQLGPEAPHDPDAADSRESKLLGGALPSVPELATDASPVHHVSSLAPPFLLLHGTADRFVPPGQSELLSEALAGCGVPVTLRLIEGADHLWCGVDDAPRTAFDLTLAFLLDHLTQP